MTLDKGTLWYWCERVRAVPAESRMEDSDHDGQAGIAPDQSNVCLWGQRLDGVPFEACGLVHSVKN